MVYVRYCFDDRLHEDMLFCQSLKERTTAENIYSCINKFFEKHNLLWKYCVGVCTDGAATMTGKLNGLFSIIKRKTDSQDIIFTHCIIHREALVAKKT